MDTQNSIEIISDLKETKNDPLRVSVYVDGAYVLTLAREEVSRLGLAVGVAWEAPLADRARVVQGFGKAYKQALNRLGRRMMSQTMVCDKLKALGHGREVIDAVVERLIELGLIDDLKFGRAMIHHSHLGKPSGPAMIKQRLWGKGLKSELIDQLIQEMKDQEEYDQLEMALRLIRSRLRGLKRHDLVTRRRRLYGALSRRGFDSDIVQQAMAMLSELEAQAQEEGLL